VLETDWNWFLSDVKFLGKNSRIFLIGNNLGERCVLERVIKNDKSLGFKSIRIPVMIDNVPTWADQYTLEKILSERDEYAKIGQLNIWFAEKMCQCVSEETKIFKEEDFRYYLESFRDELLKNCNVFACLDPASSIKNTSCYRAIAVVGVDPNNQWFILDMKYGRWDSADMIDVIFSTVREYKLSDFGIEKGHYQQVIEPFLIKEMQKRNVFFNVIPLEHGKIGTKLERIKILQPRFKAHTILMPNYADWLGEFKSELAGVTKDSIKSEYIDLVDALAMIEQVAEAPVNSGQSFRDIVRNELNKGSANQSLFSIAGYR
jgi:predicted phage terminase large subunit-like protein